MKLPAAVALSICLFAYSVLRARSIHFVGRDLQLFAGLPCLQPGKESEAPSEAPADTPIDSPIDAPVNPPINAPITPPEPKLIIYATGDVPYTPTEAGKLKKQIKAIPNDAELFLHVGDIRASTVTPCVASEYDFVRGILNQSSAPLLLVIGDNEWNDCTNVDEAYVLWHNYFVHMERQWPSFESLVVRDLVYPEMFSFVQEGVLVIGLNLVGGRVQNTAEWETRLTYQSIKVQELILAYREAYNNKSKVILVGHCDPKTKHTTFFTALRNFIADTLQNQVPIMYLNGDAHLYAYEPNYLGQSSLLRVMVQGGAVEAPIRIQVNLETTSSNPAVAFTVLRNSYLF